MHTVELLDQAVALAEELGFCVRQEWLGGQGGGACEIKGQKWVYVDLALSPSEQLAQVSEALCEVRDILPMRIHPQLQRAIDLRKAA